MISIRLPFWSDGASVSVTQGVGEGTHSGFLYTSWDFALGVDHRVRAVADGVVIDIRETVPDGGSNSTGPSDPSLGSGAIGNLVTLRHVTSEGTFYSTYIHLQENSVPVNIGDTVIEGQEIGQVGNTGVRFGTHLHFQIGFNTVEFGATNYGWPDGTDNGEPQTIANASNVSANANLIQFKGYEAFGYNLPSTVVGPPPSSGNPDLIVRDLSLGSTTWADGDTISVNYNLENIGSADAANSTSRLYISTNSTITSSDTVLLTDSSSGTMNPGEVNPEGEPNSFTLDLSALGLSAGTYYVGARADDDDVVSESNEGNNVSNVIQITVTDDNGGGGNSDLIAKNFTVSSTTLTTSDTLDFTWEIENIGSGDQVNSADAGIYLSTNSTITTSDTLLHDEGFTTLGVGEEDTNEDQQGVALPSGLAPGTYYLGVIADNRREETESNEGNNVSNVIQITVTDDNSSQDTVSDFTGDGTDDILWRNSSSGTTGYWDVSSGAAQWTKVGAPNSDWDVVGTGDYNGDGTDDILWRSTSGTTGYWDVSSGSAQWTRVGAPSSVWDVVGTGDYTGDGTDDILWRNSSSGTTGYWDVSSGSAQWTGLGAPNSGWDVAGYETQNELLF